MLIVFEDRPSDSPVVERVWRSHSEGDGPFTSVATCNWNMVVTRLRGRTVLTVRGPETRATTAHCPAEGEWVGIHFKLGTFMPGFMPWQLRDRNDVNLPAASERTFLLDGSAWEYPSFDNVETFVHRLQRKGLIGRSPLVEAALDGRTPRASQRTLQRQFLRDTGMTPNTMFQIERARRAAHLLRCGTPIVDVANGLGYYDQAHLTRSLKHLAGLTPAAIARGEEQLSFLYNTERAESSILAAGRRRSREKKTWTRYPHSISGPGGS